MAIHIDHHPRGYRLAAWQIAWTAAPLIIVTAFLLWTIIAYSR